MPWIIALSYWRQIALVSMILAVFAYHWNAVRSARKEGFAMCQAEAQKDINRRLNNALEAEKRLRDSGALSDKRLFDNDGFRRPE